MPNSIINLQPKLYDLFQHSEVKCNAACCGWAAFDFSDRWVTRWCEIRDSKTVATARSETEQTRALIAERDDDSTVEVENFFRPTVESLSSRLELIARILADFESR